MSRYLRHLPDPRHLHRRLPGSRWTLMTSEEARKDLIEAVCEEGYSLYEYGTTKFGEVCTDTPLTAALVALALAPDPEPQYCADCDNSDVVDAHRNRQALRNRCISSDNHPIQQHQLSDTDCNALNSLSRCPDTRLEAGE